jgi:hypothetical protein
VPWPRDPIGRGTSSRDGGTIGFEAGRSVPVSYKQANSPSKSTIASQIPTQAGVGRFRSPQATVPSEFDPRTVCLTVDVEWSSPEVLADIVGLLDERGLAATLFVTHEGVNAGSHERGIHPNYRRSGDLGRAAEDASMADDSSLYEHIVTSIKSFVPDAVGVRGHSLHYDSLLLPIYQRQGIEYDSTYQMPLVPNLAPFWKEYEILEIPIYFNDFFELKTGALGFDAQRLPLSSSGLKVIDIHPVTVFTNTPSLDYYQALKTHYHDADRLLESRHRGAGIRSLVIGLLDRLADQDIPVSPLAAINSMWRSSSAG